jgi:predicted helicase
MKGEMIDAIASEINRQNRVFKDQVVMRELNENGVLIALYRDYKEKLFPGTDKQEFATIYSQTVIFGLLRGSATPTHSRSAGCRSFEASSQQCDEKTGFQKVLLKSPHKKDIKEILKNIIDKLIGLDTVVIEILKSITTIDIPEQLFTFILESKEKLAAFENTDDVLAMVYERFLKRYEPVLHRKINYYYTPGPVVSFMVHAVHNLLKEKLKIEEGLGDLDIGILDPAFGTGNFLAEVMRLVIEEKAKKYGEGVNNSFIKSHLSNSIHGFEILLPLYLLGHINLLKIIKSFYGGVQGGRLFQKKPPLGNLYLTDTLANKERLCGAPVGVIFCNPPYSRHSFNKGQWLSKLVRDYFQVKGRRIEEKNLKGLQDDYVKFFRVAQWKIDQTGSGVMAFIANNSYLENPTFRGMRYSLLKSFDEIYILDLYGVARKSDKHDDDENIFGVGQGIAIGFFIKLEKSSQVKNNLDNLNCRVYYSGMKGSKAGKLKHLEKIKEGNIKNVQWERVFPAADFYLFTPGKRVDIYEHFIKVTDIFPVHSVGIVTAKDKLTIKSNKEEMYETVKNFSKVDEAFARHYFKLGDDTRDWKVIEAQKDIMESGIDRNRIVPILYRPFDIRYTYYTGKSRGFLCMPRPALMRHMLGENIGLITVRQVPNGIFSHCFVTDTIIESRLTTCQKGIAYIFPLYKYIFDGEERKKNNFKNLFPGKSMPRQSNISPGVLERLQGIFGMDNQPSSSQIFYYVYAILHSGIYREKYRDHLKIDFPRIPFTTDVDLFLLLSCLGEKLASVHLMKSPELVRTFCKYEVIGSDLVYNPLFKPTAGGDGRVYINETQYFSNISVEMWEFEICGYQVLKKWLWDRKKKFLTPGEIHHYIKICRALQLTVNYCEDIDVLYSLLEKTL